MKHLKQLAALTVLSGSLIAPAIALAEPTPPPGTTVNTIALTTVQTNVSSTDHGHMSNMNMRDSAVPNHMNAPMTDMSDDEGDEPAVNNNAGMTPTP